MDLNSVRKKLMGALGDENKKYFTNMKLWFRQKITKEDFDMECRKLFRSEHVHLHNEFLLCILNKCHSLTASSVSGEGSSQSPQLKDKLKKGKLKKKAKLIRATFEHRFHPVNPLPTCPQWAPLPEEGGGPVLCVRDAMLPDIGMVHGRMYVTAWDMGLDGVEDEAVQILMIAIEHILKAVLTAVFSRRRPYKLRERRFVYSSGAAAPDPYRRNTYGIYDSTVNSHATGVTRPGEHVPSLKPTSEWAEQEALYAVACTKDSTLPLPPISLQDVFEALQVHRSTLPSHSVYAVNMERILANTWHPGPDELQQDDIYRQQDTILMEETSNRFDTG